MSSAEKRSARDPPRRGKPQPAAWPLRSGGAQSGCSGSDRSGAGQNAVKLGSDDSVRTEIPMAFHTSVWRVGRHQHRRIGDSHEPAVFASVWGAAIRVPGTTLHNMNATVRSLSLAERNTVWERRIDSRVQQLLKTGHSTGPTGRRRSP